MFINDIDCGLASEVQKFADDTKLYKVVRSTEEQAELQRDLWTLEEWAAKWRMSFNADKCKVLHLGRNNERYGYVMNGGGLGGGSEERDLGIIISEDLKPAKHCAAVCAKANGV